MNKVYFLGLVVLLGLFSSCDSSRKDDEVAEYDKNKLELPSWFNPGTYALGRNGESKSNVKVTITKNRGLRGITNGLNIMFQGYNGDYTSRALYIPTGQYEALAEVGGTRIGGRVYVIDDKIYIESDIASNVSMDGLGYITIVIERYNPYGDIKFSTIQLPAAFRILGKEDKYSGYAKWLKVVEDYESQIRNGVEQRVFTRMDK